MAKLTANQRAYKALLKKYTKYRIAALVGVSRQAVNKWSIMPAAWVRILSEKTEIPVEELLPDPCEDCQNPFCPKNQSPT